MARYQVRSPDGQMHIIEGPDDATPDQVIAAAQTTIPSPKAAPAATSSAPARSVVDQIISGDGQGHGGIANFVGKQPLLGALKGASEIGTTIMAPFQWAQDKLAGKTGPSTRQETQQGIEGGLDALGAEKGSTGYQSGRLAAEMAGTSGAGGAVGNVARALGASPRVVSALMSSGMTTGGPTASTLAGRAADLGLRSVAGAATGAATTGLIDPESAVTGAAVGAALPPALKAAQAVIAPATRAVAGAVSRATMPPTAAGATDILKALGAETPQQQAALVQQLREAPTLVPGAPPTMAQALQTPEASILQRVVHDSPGAASLRDRIAAQSAARTAALEGVAPTNAAGIAQAREDLGVSVANQMLPERQRLGAQVSAMYDGVDPQGAVRVGLPLPEMGESVGRYLGPGSFGQGSRAQQALDEARSISTAPAGPTTFALPTGAAQTPAKWGDLQRLRSSMGDAWREASDKGRSQEAAALNEMRRSLDARIDAAAAGTGKLGDNMPTEAADAWREANRSYAALQDRFHTGPQAGIFKQGGDGQPAKQGGEIASAFWGNRPGLASDVASFRRLVDDQPGLLGQFKSLITTHGAATADRAGNLTSKFSKWVDQTLPGLRGTFSGDEVQSLQRIAQDIDRAEAAKVLGTSLGGSNTYQNASNALGLGLLDSPALERAARMIPGIGAVTGPALDYARKTALMGKSTRMANLLSDSTAAADAIEQLQAARDRSTSAALADLLVPAVYRGAPRSILRGSQ